MRVDDRTLIRGGAVVSLDPGVGDLREGDVLIEGDKIADIAPSIAVEATVIDARGMIVLPGLVDSHRHLWQTGTRSSMVDGVLSDLVDVQWPQVAAHMTPEDVYACVLAGALEALMSGVTTLLDWCHIINSPAHAEHNLRALRDAGLRGRFLYGASMARKLDEYQGRTAHADTRSHAEMMYERDFPGDDGLVRFGLALQGPDTSTIEITRAEIEHARRLGVPMGFHVGVPQGPPPRQSIAALARVGLLGPDMNFAHCCDSTDEELRLLADAGATATACPSVDLALGLGVPAHGRMRDAGLRPAVAVDSVIASSGDLFAELRLGLLCERMRRAGNVFSRGRAVVDTGDLAYSAREALASATINAAYAMWLGNEVGSLTPSKKADVILLRATDLNLVPASDLVASVVGSAHAGNVDSVFVGGRRLVADGLPIGFDLGGVRDDLNEARDRMFAYAGYSGMRPDA